MADRGSIKSGTVSISCAALRSAISSSSPLRFDATTLEPYLPFPPGKFQSFRVTPPRLTDVADKVSVSPTRVATAPT